MRKPGNEQHSVKRTSGHLYTVLGVWPDADPDKIKATYRRLSLQYHPDKNQGRSAEEQQNATKQMGELNQAYKILSDPIARERYDDEYVFAAPLESTKHRAQEPKDANELRAWLLEDREKHPRHQGFCVAARKLAAAADPEGLCNNIIALIQAGRLSYADFEADSLRNAIWNNVLFDASLIQFLQFADPSFMRVLISDPRPWAFDDIKKFAPRPIAENERRNSEPTSADELKNWLLADRTKYPGHLSFWIAAKKLAASGNANVLCENIFKLIQAGRLSYADFENDRVRNAPWNVVFCDEQVSELMLTIKLETSGWSGPAREMLTIEIIEKFYNDHDDADLSSALSSGCVMMEASWQAGKEDSRPFTYNDRLLLYILEQQIKGQPNCYTCINSKGHLENPRCRPAWIADTGIRDVAWVNMLDELFAYRDGNSQLTAKSLRAQLNLVAQFVHGKSVIGDIYQHLFQPIIDAKAKLELEQQNLQYKLKLKFASQEERQSWQDPDTIRAIKIQQLDAVIQDLTPILKKGAQDLLILHKEQLIANGQPNDRYTALNDTGKQLLNAKSQEIFKAAADKVREYETKAEIKKHRNNIGKILNVILGAVAGVFLVISCAVLFKSARRSYRAGFFDNRTQTELKKARRDLVEGKRELRW